MKQQKAITCRTAISVKKTLFTEVVMDEKGKLSHVPSASD